MYGSNGILAHLDEAHQRLDDTEQSGQLILVAVQREYGFSRLAEYEDVLLLALPQAVCLASSLLLALLLSFARRL